MRKFGLFAALALIPAGFGAWIASTSQTRIAPMNGARIDAPQMMTVAQNLPELRFVDYSLVYE